MKILRLVVLGRKNLNRDSCSQFNLLGLAKFTAINTNIMDKTTNRIIPKFII